MEQRKFNPAWLLLLFFVFVALSDLRVFDPLISQVRIYEENKRMENPAYAKDRSLEALQRDMEAKANALSTGEQLDMMIAAMKAGQDMTRTADPTHGRFEQAPLVNYVYKRWSYDMEMGGERLNMLLSKIDRSGRPSMGQLKRYQFVAKNCSLQEVVEQVDPTKEAHDCKEYDRMINSAGHSRTSAMFASSGERY